MKKSILIGSIFAVVLIVVASFPSVVSYNVIKKPIDKDNPQLFFKNLKNTPSVNRILNTTTGFIGAGFIILMILYLIWGVLLNFPVLEELFMNILVTISLAIGFSLYFILEFLFVMIISYVVHLGLSDSTWYPGSFFSYVLRLLLEFIKDKIRA